MQCMPCMHGEYAPAIKAANLNIFLRFFVHEVFFDHVTVEILHKRHYNSMKYQYAQITLQCGKRRNE